MAVRVETSTILDTLSNYIKTKLAYGIPNKNSIDRTGRPGSTLYRISHTLILVWLSLLAYAAALIIFGLYAVSSSSRHGLNLVLWRGDFEIPQFLSSFVLLVFFTPAAILVQSFSGNVALLHPFALASKVPTAIGDLDELMDPGVMACIKLFTYSKRRAAVQALIILVGALIGPTGALLMFPGVCNDPVSIKAAVGMPTTAGQRSAFSVMDQNGSNGFSTPVAYAFRGSALEKMGKIQPLPGQVGPLESANLTYEEGLRYNGIVTYNWSSGCKPSEKYTSFTTHPKASRQYQTASRILERRGQYSNSTRKDKSVHQPPLRRWNNDPKAMVLEGVISANKSDLMIFSPDVPSWLVRFFGTSNTQRSDSTSIEWLMWGSKENTSNFDTAKTTADSRFWVASVHCTPTIDWEVSNCLWTNGSFTQCFAAPGQNTTELDIPSLDGLQYHMGSIAEQLIDDDLDIFGFNAILLSLVNDPHGANTFDMRVPNITDFDNMYGLLAQSIVLFATQGPFGIATVTATGPKTMPALLVRTYILAIVIIAMTVTPLLPAGVLYWDYRKHRMPLHRATFLTVTNATRGQWWDTTMYGTCVMKSGEIREKLKGIKVMFGATLEEEPGEGKVPSQHVGLALEVARVDPNETYYGLSQKMKID